MRKIWLSLTLFVLLSTPSHADGPISGTSLNLTEAIANASANTLAPAAMFGSTSAGWGANTMTLSSDSLTYSGQNYISTLHLDHNFGGAGMTGSRAGLDVSMIMRGPSSNRGNTAQYYVGIADYLQCGFNDNGTAGLVNAAGSCVAINPIADLGAGSFWYTLNAEEVDVISAKGSSAAHTFGTLWVKSGTGPRGTYDDAALAFASGGSAPTWGTLIQVGKTDGTPPTAADTKLIACARNSATGAPCALGSGVDLRDFAITNAAFASAGFSVDGAGKLAAASVSTSSLTAPGGQVGSIVLDTSNGGYTTVPMVVIAPPASGIQATAAVSAYGMAQWSMTSGGAGYKVSDVLSFSPNGATSAVHLVLNISEDAWQGDAQYTISIDGQQLGGTRTATASHATGQTEAVPVDTALTPGPHSVVVNFLNDAYGGTPATDRNLYVDGLVLNGAVVPNQSAVLLSAGPAPLSLTVPAPTATAAGGSPAKVIVTAVDGQGAITATAGLDGGNFPALPPTSVLAIGGSGGGAQFSMTAYVKAIGVTSGGSGYTAPPAVSVTGTTGGGTAAHAVIGGNSSGVLIGAFVRPADPTTADIPAGQCADWNNSATGSYRHVCNFAGGLRSVAMN